MKRTAFVLNVSGHGWLGGVSYYRNLLGALMNLPDRKIEPVVLTAPSTQAVEAARAICAIDPIQSPLADTLGMNWKLRRGLQRYWERDLVFEQFAKRHDIALLSHSGHLGRRSKVATLPWIPDFQELYYPEFFTPKDREARVRNAAEVGRNATSILLSSEAAREDLCRIDKSLGEKAELLRFVADVLSLEKTPDSISICRKYGVDGPYFLLPNQFWAHKNHVVIVDALALLKERGFEPTIVATGNTADHRQPNYFPSLMARVAKLNLEKSFNPIGTVTYEDLMALMRGAVALINPSLFEGWSTTVEEAKSLGKAIILSDIAVHREQAPPRARFFSATSKEEAAVALEAEWSSWDPNADRMAQAEAGRHVVGRREAFARTYQDIALRTMNKAGA